MERPCSRCKSNVVQACGECLESYACTVSGWVQEQGRFARLRMSRSWQQLDMWPACQLQRRRKQVRRACGRCRRSKVGCDEGRPCARCMRTGRSCTETMEEEVGRGEEGVGTGSKGWIDLGEMEGKQDWMDGWE